MTGQNVLYGIINTGLYYYFQSVVFLPAMMISVLFAVAKLWDVVKDILMGGILDNTKSKRGKCRPYLLFAPVFVAIVTILPFLNIPYGGGNEAWVNALILLWAVVSYFLWTTVYSVGDIPLFAAPSLMTDVVETRSKLISFGKILANIGASLTMVLFVPFASIISTSFTDKTDGIGSQMWYGCIIAAVILTVLGYAMFQMSGIFMKERIVKPPQKKTTIKSSLKKMWGCKPYRSIMLSSIIRGLTFVYSSVQMTFFVYYFGNNGGSILSYLLYYIVLVGIGYVGQLIAMSLTPKVAKKVDKKKLYIGTCIVGIFAFSALFVVFMLGAENLTDPLWMAVLVVVFVVTSSVMGVIAVLQGIMFTDCIDYEEYVTGSRPDGVFMSGQTITAKLSAGIATLVIGIVFAIVGFSGDGVREVGEALAAGAVFATDPQFETYRIAMFALCSLPAALGFLLTLIPMRSYNITNESHAKILVELAKIRQDEIRQN